MFWNNPHMREIKYMNEWITKFKVINFSIITSSRSLGSCPYTHRLYSPEIWLLFRASFLFLCIHNLVSNLQNKNVRERICLLGGDFFYFWGFFFLWFFSRYCLFVFFLLFVFFFFLLSIYKFFLIFSIYTCKSAFTQLK